MVDFKTPAVALATALCALSVFSPCGRAPTTSEPRKAPEARRYRDLTKHTPESARATRHPVDWANKPALYRSYPGAEIVPLPSPHRLTQPALTAIAGVPPAAVDAPQPLDLQRLGTILFLTGGISGTRPTSGGDIRATAAAGALYPNDLYVVTGDLPDLPAGIYHYDPGRKVLTRLRTGDWRAALAMAALDERIQSTPVTMVLTGILWRSAWKYGERAYRHLHWDGGMMLAHTLAAAEASGLAARVLGAFIDDDVDSLIGADGRREKTLAVVPLGFGPSGTSSTLTRAGHPVPPLAFKPTPLSRRPIDYPEALRYHAASRLTDADAVRELRSASFRSDRFGRSVPSAHSMPPPMKARGDPTLDTVIRMRRSTRRFAHSPMSLAELATILERSTRGFPADFLGPHKTLLETYVIVNAIQGVEPGAYHYDRESHRLQLLKSGSFRQSAGFLCLDQALARDASAVLYYLTDLDALAGTFGERGYRLAELEGGLVAGRAYLATHAVGRGATGLTFYDDEVSRFFSPHAAGLEPVLVVAVGVPRKRS